MNAIPSLETSPETHPSPSPRLDFTEVGSFKMGIYGLPRWLKLSFDQWEFAVPISPVAISAQEHVSLDLWPKFKRHRRIKYEFELLETALQTTYSGISVIHCPDFVIKLLNQRMGKDRMLVRLPYPSGMKEPDRAKIFCVSMKDNPNASRFIKRTARFVRSLK